MNREKYDATKKYKVQCRAIMKQDLEVPGNEVERARKEWLKKFEGRSDFQPYFMIQEVKNDS